MQHIDRFSEAHGIHRPMGVAGMVLFPILFYPFSKTLWIAIDLYFFNPWRLQPGTGLRKTR